MRVDVAQRGSTFEYRLHLDAEDRSESRRLIAPAGQTGGEAIRRVGEGYRVELPGLFRGIHPDLHATAIWYTLRPWLGGTLQLPFGVSRAYAEGMEQGFGVRFPNVDRALRPREAPRRPRPCGLVSGGMDSTATAMILPRDTAFLFLDRIPYFLDQPSHDLILVDQVRARELVRELQRNGRDAYILRDDHEALARPYPTWHSEMSIIAPLYMADTFDIGPYETGDVLCVFTMRGYHDGQVDSWRFRPLPLPGDSDGLLASARERAVAFADERLPDWVGGLLRHRPHAGARATSGDPFRPFDAFPLVGIEKVSSTYGLSEVATARIVSQGPYEGKTWSCYYKSASSYCLRCDKCFKKIMLMYIAKNEEVPEQLFEQFLRYPHLASIFRRPYFDWHHVWYYVFQNLRCRHWFVQELQRQAKSGPDASFLARWYPDARRLVPRAYRAEVEENILRYVEPMTRDDVQRLQSIDFPPLHAPPLP